MFNKNEFCDFIINNDIVGFFEKPITLKSGRISNWYANWRNVVEDVYLIDKLADFIISFVKSNNIEFDCIYGVPEGASKTAIISQFKFAKEQPNFGKGSHVLPMGRGKVKEHGAPKDKFFVGIPRGKVVVIEDVTTTGGSLIANLDKLKEAGVEVACTIALFNRMEKTDDGKSVEEKIAELGVRHLCMSTAYDVFPRIIEKLKPSQEMINELKSYFDKYGIKPLNI